VTGARGQGRHPPHVAHVAQIINARPSSLSQPRPAFSPARGQLPPRSARSPLREGRPALAARIRVEELLPKTAVRAEKALRAVCARAAGLPSVSPSVEQPQAPAIERHMTREEGFFTGRASQISALHHLTRAQMSQTWGDTSHSKPNPFPASLYTCTNALIYG
jgi:hypothetical protein